MTLVPLVENRTRIRTRSGASCRMYRVSFGTPRHHLYDNTTTQGFIQGTKPIVYDSTGKAMVKTLPAPGSDVAQILPPCASTSIRAM